MDGEQHRRSRRPGRARRGATRTSSTRSARRPPSPSRSRSPASRCTPTTASARPSARSASGSCSTCAWTSARPTRPSPTAIEDTVDYGEVCQLVALIAQQRSHKTLERLCSTIADRLLADYELEGVWVKATKPEPPIALPWTRSRSRSGARPRSSAVAVEPSGRPVARAIKSVSHTCTRSDNLGACQPISCPLTLVSSHL